MERTLAVPAVKGHTEVRQILLKCRQFLAIGDILKQFQALILGKCKVLVPLAVNDALRRLHNVRPMIAVIGKVHLLAEEFQIACIDRHGKEIHLIPRIVDVILTVHRIARRTQEIYECRADRRTTPVPDVERSRRIRTDVLHLYARCIVRRQCTIRLTCGKNGTQRIGDHRLFEVEIEESRTCNLRMIEPVSGQMLLDRCRNLLRRPTKDACRLHRKIRRKIAKLLFRRFFEKNRGQRTALRQLPCRHSRIHGTDERLLYLLFDIHLD